MNYLKKIIFFIINFCLIAKIKSENVNDFVKMIGRCQVQSSKYETCMKNALNDMRVFYKTGIPEFNIRPFDPHHASYVEQRRGNIEGLGGYKLILRNVSEYGWSISEVTNFKLDRDNNQILYDQYFPEKSLRGFYEFTAMIMGTPIKRHGSWNLTLYRYSQRTTVKRPGPAGSELKVHIAVQEIGNMDLHIENFFGTGRNTLNAIADTVINSMWELGLPVVTPLINDLVSTAFTAIFNKSFRYFPIDNYIR